MNKHYWNGLRDAIGVRLVHFSERRFLGAKQNVKRPGELLDHNCLTIVVIPRLIYFDV
jgi:hypothetical protein